VVKYHESNLRHIDPGVDVTAKAGFGHTGSDGIARFEFADHSALSSSAAYKVLFDEIERFLDYGEPGVQTVAGVPDEGRLYIAVVSRDGELRLNTARPDGVWNSWPDYNAWPGQPLPGLVASYWKNFNGGGIAPFVVADASFNRRVDLSAYYEGGQVRMVHVIMDRYAPPQDLDLNCVSSPGSFRFVANSNDIDVRYQRLALLLSTRATSGLDIGGRNLLHWDMDSGLALVDGYGLGLPWPIRADVGVGCRGAEFNDVGDAVFAFRLDPGVLPAPVDMHAQWVVVERPGDLRRVSRRSNVRLY
jgi:hypothetical protein